MISTSDLVALATAAVIALGAMVLGFGLRALVLRRLLSWAARTTSRFDDAMVESLRRPIPWWTLLVGVQLALWFVELPARAADVARDVLLPLLIVSLTVWLADLGGRLLVAASLSGNLRLPATGLALSIVRVGILALGAIMLLDTLGVSVAPVLAALGIGGLAVALGLQETLANLFAGIQVTLARNIRVGDFIRLESGEEGHVEDVGWRTTRLRLLPNNIVLIPNSRLAQSIVTNYALPSQDLAVLVKIGVHYGSDLARVEQVTSEVGREVMHEVQGGVPDFEPFIRYSQFADSSINFNVILRVQQFTDQFLVRHEFIKRVHARYQAENIVIPYPIRALNLDQEGVRLPTAS